MLYFLYNKQEKNNPPTIMDYTKASRKDVIEAWIGYESRNAKVEEFFTTERNQWDEEKKNILDIFSSKDLERICSELQSANLAFRSRSMERITSTMSRLSKETNQYKKSLGDRREYYLTNFGLKVSDTQTKEMLNRDLSEVQRSIDILETHIEYLRENIKWSDQIGYAVKNKIEIQRLKYND